MVYMERNEIRRLIETVKQHNGPNASLHATMFLTAFWHGLRASELVAITAGQVVNGQLRVQRLKRSLETVQDIRIDPNDPTMDNTGLIQLAQSKPSTERLFPMTRQYADRLLKFYAERAGLDKSKAHVHVFKHSIAMAVYEVSGRNVDDVVNHLGHRSLTSSLVYIRTGNVQRTQALVNRMVI